MFEARPNFRALVVAASLSAFSTTAFAADEVGTVTLGWLKSTANLIAVEAPKLSSKYGLED